MIHEDSVQLTEQQLVRDSIQDICEDFDVAYWRKRDVARESSHEYDVERYFGRPDSLDWSRSRRNSSSTPSAKIGSTSRARTDIINERTLAVTDKGQWSTDRTYDANTGTNN